MPKTTKAAKPAERKKSKRIPSDKRAQIALEKFNNPDLTVREIAEKTDTSKSSVDRIVKQEVGQVGTLAKKTGLYEANLRTIAAGAEKVAKALETFVPSDIREAKEMQSIIDTALKQNLLSDGEPTENVGVVDGAVLLMKIRNGEIKPDSAYEALRGLGEAEASKQP